MAGTGTNTTTAPATPQLPEGFIDRLQVLIPEASDPKLYALLATTPFASEVLDRLDGHYMGLQRDDSGMTSLNNLHTASKIGDLLKEEYFPGYSAASRS